MNGKIIINKPKVCICVIKLDGKLKQLNALTGADEVELAFGTHKINIGIEYSDTGHIGMDHGHPDWDDIEWAWKEDKEIVIDDTVKTIKLKRKWHLFKHITADAIISK